MEDLKVGENQKRKWNIKTYVQHLSMEVTAYGLGCTCAAGVKYLKFIHGIMDENVYLNILKENLDRSTKNLNLEGSFIF